MEPRLDTETSPAGTPGPALVERDAVMIMTFLFTPLLGGLVCAWNWWRAGLPREGLRALGVGLGLYLLVAGLSLIPVPAVRAVVLLGAALGSALLARRDQDELRARVPNATRGLWQGWATLGLLIRFSHLCCTPGDLYWIITGDPAFTPR